MHKNFFRNNRFTIMLLIIVAVFGVGVTTVKALTNLLPDANDQFDVGAYGLAWKDMYASGTIYTDVLNAFGGGLSTSTFQGGVCVSGSSNCYDTAGLLTVKPNSVDDGLFITESDGNDTVVELTGNANSGAVNIHYNGILQHIINGKTGVAFNNRALAVDFRVKSDNDQEIFSIQGEDDKIGISTRAPSEMLTVFGGNLAVGNGMATTTLYGDGSGTGTSTLKMESHDGSNVSCIQMVNTDGNDTACFVEGTTFTCYLGTCN